MPDPDPKLTFGPIKSCKGFRNGARCKSARTMRHGQAERKTRKIASIGFRIGHCRGRPIKPLAANRGAIIAHAT
jgi:hypothetical protein